MNCFTHSGSAAVGTCVFCGKGACHQCVAKALPFLVCQSCASGDRGLGSRWYGWYGYAYEYRSSTTIGGWPLVHMSTGIDPVTMRPRIARGVVAIGNVAVGVLAIGGLACGLVTVGGASIGLLFAVGGAALGLGVSLGGLAVGSIAIGGAAVGFVYAAGGGAFGPSVIDGRHCDEAARGFVQRWLPVLTRNCP